MLLIKGKYVGGRIIIGKEERAYLEMVILVPDSAMIRFRVPPPFPADTHKKYVKPMPPHPNTTSIICPDL